MTIKTITWATYTAHLEPMTGQGLLVLPDPADDLRIGGPGLHEAGWDQIVRELDRLDFEPMPGEDGEPLALGFTLDGREVLSLYGLAPIISQPVLEEIAAGFDALARAVGGIG